MPKITLAEGISVGANSFEKESTQPRGVYAGIPAKRIKNRSKDLLYQWNLFNNNNLEELVKYIEQS
ncbi:MAG: hypothetical protein HDS69_02920 [Bacteroidales bacterium]|nr:hypothetical protein [Bacteroidales bacterium]MBD5228975.1 hypothetical protein [Bacteroidales bacterium]